MRRTVVVVLIAMCVLAAACSGSSSDNKKGAATGPAARNYAIEGVPQVGSGGPLLSVLAWGDNDYGQAGIGSVCDPHGQPECYVTTPTSVRAPGGAGQLSRVLSLVAGGFHTLALRQDRSVVAWGSNQRGQLGNGTHADSGPAPVVVKGVAGLGNLSGVRALGGGGAHSLALLPAGRVVAWGDNNFGQLGIGTSTGPSQCAPSAPTAPSPPPAPTSGANTTPPLAVIPAAEASAGDGVNRACAETPTAVLAPDGNSQFRGVAAVSGGDTHSVALLDDGTVWTWGLNDYGQLGITNHDGPEQCKPYSKYDSVGCSTKPVQVTGPGGVGHLTDVKAISAGADFTLALRKDGTVWAWGSNAWTTLGQTDPALLEQCATPWAPVPQYCSTKPLQVVGSNGAAALTDVTAVSAEGFSLHAAALKSDGTVWTWGVNATGELGNGASSQYEDAPVPVVDDKGQFTDVVDVHVSGKSTVALKKDGTVWAWGYNGWGQLGIGNNTGPQTCTETKIPCALEPQQVHGVGGTGFLTNVATLAAGGTHIVAGTPAK